MWFKGLLFLCNAALLVAPTNAASPDQDGVAGKQNHQPRALSYGYLHPERRAPQQGTNQTRTTEHETGKNAIEPTSSVVVIPTTDVETTAPPTVPAEPTTPVSSSFPPTTSSTTSSTSSFTSSFTSSSTTPSTSSFTSSFTSSSTTSSSTTSSLLTSLSTTSLSTSSSSTSSTTPRSSLVEAEPTGGIPTSESTTETSKQPTTTPVPAPSTSTTLEDGATTTNPTTSTDAVSTSEVTSGVGPTTIDDPTKESTKDTSKTVGEQLPPTSPPATTSSTSTRTSPTSTSFPPPPKSTGEQVPPATTAVPSPPLLGPSDQSSDSTADATTAIPTSENPTNEVTSPPVIPTTSAEENSITDIATKPDPGSITGNDSTFGSSTTSKTLNPTAKVTTGTSATTDFDTPIVTDTTTPTGDSRTDTNVPETTPSPIVSLPTSEQTDIVNGTTSLDSDFPEVSTTNLQQPPTTNRPISTTGTDDQQVPTTTSGAVTTSITTRLDSTATTGLGSTATTGIDSTTTGLGSTATTGIDSTTTGLGSTTTGLGSTTTGLGSTTTGLGSTTTGLGSTTTGLGSTTTGLGSTTTGLGSTTTGLGSTTTGLGSTTTGLGSTTTGLGSTTISDIKSAGPSTGVEQPSSAAASSPFTATDLLLIPTLGTDPTLNVSAGIPASETMLTTILPTLPTSDVLSLTDGVSLPGASGTGNRIDPTALPTTIPTLVDTSNMISTVPASTSIDTPATSALSTTNLVPTQVLPTQPLLNATLANPTPSGASTTATGISTTRAGIPTIEDGPTTTSLSEPGSTVGTTDAFSIATSGVDDPMPTGVTSISTGINPTGVETEETTIKPPSTIPTSESNLATEPDQKEDKPPAQDTSVTEGTQPTQPSAQPTGKSTQVSDTNTQPVTSDATFGTYMSTPTGYIPGTSTEPLVAFPTGPTPGKDGEAPPPPLTKKQTAGIAIGGTTCLLIALVAALFLARRYHQNAAKRKSTGSVYPEVAYLYDPPVDGNADAEAGGGVPTMSGGNGGLVAAAVLGRPSSNRHTVDYSTLPQNSPSHPPTGFGTTSRPASTSITQSPFRDPEVRAHGAATNAAAVENPFRDPVIPEPQPSPSGDYAQLAALAIKPYANPAASDYPPMSPYGSVVSEDPFADPFEHDNTDLLLNVDLGTETVDSIVVLAPPLTPHSPFTERRPASPTLGANCHYEPPAPCASHFPGRDSKCNSMIPGNYTPEGRYMPDRHLSMGPPVAPLGRLSPAYSSSTPTLLMASPLGRSTPDSIASEASSRTTVTPEPITAPERAASPPPVSRGWDEIMDEPVPIPAPLSVAVTRKPLPQRSQPTLSGPGQLLVATPLIIKKKPVAGANLLVPPSPYGPAPSKTETMSDDLTVQRKRSGELLFADPHLIGRSF